MYVRRPLRVPAASADDSRVARRIFYWAATLVGGVVLGVSTYAGLVKAGVAKNPFAPSAGGDLALARSSRPGHRVLFVGNSFTFRNDLPRLVHELSAGTDPVFAGSYTAGGWQLKWFAKDRGLDRLLHEVHWDVVVLQEQSQIPSFDAAYRAREFDPYVQALAWKIEAAGARPLLFLTWGYRTGDRHNVPRDTYAWMQQRLVDGYSNAAREVRAQIAPVGLAWAEALRRRPELGLWADDDRHPSREGSYLAACVFYATLTGKDPRLTRFTDGLSDARFLQHVAWDVARSRY